MQKQVDFIIIGSGIAGLNTALTLASYGKVLITTKKNIDASSTYLAQGGIAAVLTKDDSIDSHVNDTLTAGYFHNKKTAVNFLVKQGSSAIKKLVHFGVNFDKTTDGNFVSSYEAAHSYPRILHATDFTGKAIQTVLMKKALENKNIEIWENSSAIDLIVKGKQCLGVTVLRHPELVSGSNEMPKLVRHDSFINVFARATILATGGTGQLYKWTTNPSVSTGDGIAIANRAKVSLSDLEFVQFHPTALQEDASPLLLLSEALRGEGAVLKNEHGKRFMDKIHPDAELAPRDVVARTIFAMQKKGKVYLDITHKPKSFLLKRFPNIYKELQKRGYDLAKDLIPVTPAAHFMCGGIKTDIYGRSSLKNLFAYGEAAATGVHGANRLASNSLLEGMVFSDQIKKCIDEIPSKTVIANEVKRSQRLLRHVAPRNDFKAIKIQIQNIMWENVGITRSTKNLEIAMKKLNILQKRVEKIESINENLLEVKNMLETAKLITFSAQKRKKSLGAHFFLKN